MSKYYPLMIWAGAGMVVISLTQLLSFWGSVLLFGMALFFIGLMCE
jgi:hypothetical protein